MSFKNISLALIAIGFFTCVKAQNSNKEYTGIDKEKFDKLYETAKTKTPNYTIVFGLTVGVSELDFDTILAEKIKNGDIKAINMNTYPPIIQFDVLNMDSIPMGVHCSASGTFKNFPLISFGTGEIKDTLELNETRNKLIDWAIAKYGDQYYVSSMTDYSSSSPKKNFRWVADTYSIDITDVMNRVSLTYRKLK